jgi:hypothetical protein
MGPMVLEVMLLSVKVQTPLARLRHCCATAGPVQGQLVGTSGGDKTQDGWSRQIRDGREEEE